MSLPGPTETDRVLGRALLRARTNAQLSREDASRKSGVSRATIRNMELGHFSVRASNLAQLATVYGTTPDILMGFVPRGQEELLSALTDEITALRKERDTLLAKLRGVVTGSVRCGEPHWRRRGIVCQMQPGHDGNHRNETVRLAWTCER